VTGEPQQQQQYINARSSTNGTHTYNKKLASSILLSKKVATAKPNQEISMMIEFVEDMDEKTVATVIVTTHCVKVRNVTAQLDEFV
jgi:hypothetical protein